MRRKLSQRSRDDDRAIPPDTSIPVEKDRNPNPIAVGPRRSTKVRRTTLAVVMLVSMTACPETSRVGELNGGRDTGPTGATKRPDAKPDPFQWPTGEAHPVITLEITKKDGEGTIEIELMPELAPRSVEHVVTRVRAGYYDRTTFHRVIPGFMIQGGDPNSRDRDPSNDGRGGADVALPDEFSDAPYARGVVALANRGRPNSNSDQIFIMQQENRDLDGNYTTIGRVIRGIEVVDAIANTPTDKVGRWGPKDRPLEDVVIRRATLAPDTR